MCFPVYDCLFCIKLDVATKLIGVIYALLSAGLTVLFGVPVTMAWQALPDSRAWFYTAMAVSSGALFVASCMLIIGAFWKKPFLLLPWVVTAFFISVPLLVTCVVGMVTLPLRHSSADGAADESCVISAYFVYAVLLFYFSCVVNSHRRNLKTRDEYVTTNGLFVSPVEYHDKV